MSSNEPVPFDFQFAWELIKQNSGEGNFVAFVRVRAAVPAPLASMANANIRPFFVVPAELLSAAKSLRTEMFSHAPELKPLRIEGLSQDFRLTVGSQFIYRTLLEEDGAERRHTISWRRDLLLGGKSYSAERELGYGLVPIHELSSASQRSIRVLDVWARQRAYEKIASNLAAAFHGVPPAMPKKHPVFLSYRGPHVDAVMRLHASFNDFGNGAFFAPFLDRHNVKLGNLMGQLQERIRTSKIFVPLLTSDYAAHGSFSAFEMDYAQSLLQSGEKPDGFIAPVLVKGQSPDVGSELKKYKGVEFDSLEAVGRESSVLAELLRDAADFCMTT